MNSSTLEQFTDSLETIKNKIRVEVEQGVMPPNLERNNQKIIKLLNHSLATEIVCIHRYKQHYFASLSLGEHVVANEFLAHANEEQKHAEKLAKRISQLGGKPIFDLTQIINSAHTEFKDCETVHEMLIENLVAERIAVAVYHDIIKFIEDKDPVTRHILEQILAVEEEHVDDMYDFLDKTKYYINRKIADLKQEAEDLAMKMIAEGENMNSPIKYSEADISLVVEKLNKLDTNHQYNVSDFIPKK